MNTPRIDKLQCRKYKLFWICWSAIAVWMIACIVNTIWLQENQTVLDTIGVGVMVFGILYWAAACVAVAEQGAVDEFLRLGLAVAAGHDYSVLIASYACICNAMQSLLHTRYDYECGVERPELFRQMFYDKNLDTLAEQFGNISVPVVDACAHGGKGCHARIGNGTAVGGKIQYLMLSAWVGADFLAAVFDGLACRGSQASALEGEGAAAAEELSLGSGDAHEYDLLAHGRRIVLRICFFSCFGMNNLFRQIDKQLRTW